MAKRIIVYLQYNSGLRLVAFRYIQTLEWFICFRICIYVHIAIFVPKFFSVLYFFFEILARMAGSTFRQSQNPLQQTDTAFRFRL